MSGLFSGFEAILETIMAPVRFLGYVITTLIKFFDLLRSVVIQIFTQLGTLPNYISNYIILSASIIIVMALIGRKVGE